VPVLDWDQFHVDFKFELIIKKFKQRREGAAHRYARDRRQFLVESAVQLHVSVAFDAVAANPFPGRLPGDGGPAQ
jgi:hypothetical protein